MREPIGSTIIKALELRDKFTTVRRDEKTATMLISLLRLSCLIFDEFGTVS